MSLHRSAPLVLALASLGAALATPTLARADDKPPVIKHNPIGKGSRGDTLTITAAIEDESAIFAPTLYYRYAGSKGYTNVTMAKKGDGYSATIPATAEVEYWIEAWDELGNGPSRDGSPDRPFKIAVPDKVAAAPKPAPAPPPPPKKVEPPPEPTPAPVAVVEAPPEPAPAPTPQPTVPPQVWDSEPLLDPPEPIYTQWWFYAGIGGAAAVVTGVLVYALQPAPIYQNVVSGTQLGTTRP